MTVSKKQTATPKPKAEPVPKAQALNDDRPVHRQSWSDEPTPKYETPQDELPTPGPLTPGPEGSLGARVDQGDAADTRGLS